MEDWQRIAKKSYGNHRLELLYVTLHGESVTHHGISAAYRKGLERIGSRPCL